MGLWWGLGDAYITVYLTTRTLKALLPHGCMNSCTLPTEVSRVTAGSAVASQWKIGLARLKQTKGNGSVHLRAEKAQDWVLLKFFHS